ncbi:MAG: hypothetical protein JNL96_13730 [Planctomycetaceae bacterium]|nr:hypothetical protein [Planctomycetaceae bacterium]
MKAFFVGACLLVFVGCQSQEEKFRTAQDNVKAEQAKLDTIYNELQVVINHIASTTDNSRPVEVLDAEMDAATAELKTRYKLQKLIVEKAEKERDSIILGK